MMAAWTNQKSDTLNTQQILSKFYLFHEADSTLATSISIYSLFGILNVILYMSVDWRETTLVGSPFNMIHATLDDVSRTASEVTCTDTGNGWLWSKKTKSSERFIYHTRVVTTYKWNGAAIKSRLWDLKRVSRRLDTCLKSQSITCRVTNATNELHADNLIGQRIYEYGDGWQRVKTWFIDGMGTQFK